jgi:DNA-binding CsgD family transcriptional regulator/tetratricopeptide (TPR) repeat protein
MVMLLERDPQLQELRGAMAEAATGPGLVVLVTGEPGIGKSTLVRAFLGELAPGSRVFVGACDDLTTPRALGPFRDAVRWRGGPLADALVDSGNREGVFNAVIEELSHPRDVSVLVIEDMHWADDATLDVLQYVVRRIESVRALLVLTFRDEELTGQHPLLSLLGASAGPSVRRLPLSRLSLRAVGELSSERHRDADAIFAVTAGNPFFVTEMLSLDAEEVPATVVDAVLGRVQQLDPDTRRAVEQLSVIPTHVPHRMVDALVGGLEPLSDAEQRGILRVDRERVSFRHEIARRALEQSLPATRRLGYHRDVLAALRADPSADPAQVLHHATAAGDIDAIVEVGPGVADEASCAGAHRQALRHLDLLLAHLDRFPEDQRAALLEAHAQESYWTGRSADAVASQRRAVELRRQLGDAEALGAALRWLSRMQWWEGDTVAAEASAQEAIAILEAGAPDTATLALAYSAHAQLIMLALRDREAVGIAEHAVALARRLGEDAVLSHALNNLGTSLQRLDDPRGKELIEESLAVAMRVGADEHACRAYVNRAWLAVDDHDYTEAAQVLEEGITFSEAREQLGFLSYLRGLRARLRLETGDVHGAMEDASYVLEFPEMTGVTTVPALCVIGRLQTRRGDPAASTTFDEALVLARRSGELQRLAPVAVAMAELAWHQGDGVRAQDGLRTAYRRLVDEVGHADRLRLETAYWLWKTGGAVEETADHPWALQIAGRWQEAAARWELLGCPYERALALSEGDEEGALLEALDIVDEMGADETALLFRRQLRERGVRSVPRGRTATTRANPAGLTERQVDVLNLIVDGLTNAEIADRLVVSIRTVDHHVSAILHKLDVSSRQEAAERAVVILDEGARTR